MGAQPVVLRLAVKACLAAAREDVVQGTEEFLGEVVAEVRFPTEERIPGRGRLVAVGSQRIVVVEEKLRIARHFEPGPVAEALGDTKLMTNRDLAAMVAEKTFREDLYYRLNVVPLAVPPLRERPEDIVPLAEHFLAQFSRRLRRHFALTDEHRRLLTAYPWPGNVRELANTMSMNATLSSTFRM